MRIYLDTCCYNRPYDKQDQPIVAEETDCKQYIQNQVIRGKSILVSSYMLDYECSRIPDRFRRETILDYIDRYASIDIGAEYQEDVEDKAAEIIKTGVKFKDACHVASAIIAGCDYFITTDRRLLRYRIDEIRLVSPIRFVIETEGMKNDSTG